MGRKSSSEVQGQIFGEGVAAKPQNQNLKFRFMKRIERLFFIYMQCTHILCFCDAFLKENSAFGVVCLSFCKFSADSLSACSVCQMTQTSLEPGTHVTMHPPPACRISHRICVNLMGRLWPGRGGGRSARLNPPDQLAATPLNIACFSVSTT